MTGNIRKLTDNCKENTLKLELTMLRQSPVKIKNTNTHRDFLKELNVKPFKDKNMKKDAGKSSAKVIELLNVGLRKIEIEDKSKNKTRRF